MRVVSHRSLGSQARMVDLVRLPTWAVAVGVVLRWCARHPAVAASGVLLLWGRVRTGSWAWAWVALAAVWLGTCGVVLAWARRGSDAGLRQSDAARFLWRARRVRQRWALACEAATLTPHRNGRPPRLRKVRGTAGGGITALVNVGSAGRTAADVAESADEIAAVLGCREVAVEQISLGAARLTLAWGDALSSLRRLSDLPPAPTGQAAYGVVASGAPATIRWDLSTLVVGLSGSGKSNIAWALLAGLHQAAVPVRLRVLDPAGGVELDSLKATAHDYTDDAAKAEELVKRMARAMDARLADMARRGVRKHSPTQAEPLDLLIIDELLLLHDMLRKGAASPLGKILSVGRKAGFVVLGLSQLSQVDALGRTRDLFPQRICLATRSREMTDAVLGDGSERDGARCSAISNRTPGIGFAFQEGHRGLLRFRAAYVSDVEARQVADGSLPMRPPGRVQVALYRWFDAGDQLLYVGVTDHLPGRSKEHAESQPWWEQTARQDVEFYGSRREALAAEKLAIQTEAPVHNVVHARKSKEVAA